jgi:hypothetical protein
MNEIDVTRLGSSDQTILPQWFIDACREHEAKERRKFRRALAIWVALATILGALIFLTAVHAATPQPKPPIPTSVAFTQGTVTRSLNITSQSCQNVRITPVNGPHGQTQFRLECSNGAAQGSFVQFQTDAGPIYAQYLWPPAQCGTKPAPVVQFFECPFGTHGNGFSLTHDWQCVNGTWQPTAWTPPWIPPPPSPPNPPPGACTPNTVTWTPAVDVTGDPMIAKPARGSAQTVPHYGTTFNRISDHAVDRPSVGMIRNDYSRREPLSKDGTHLLVDCGNGFWCTYDVTDRLHARTLQQLNGPAGDSEIQWSATDDDVLYFLGRNGDTVLRQVKVSTNVATVVWDFTSAVRAFWPNAMHCWTKSEGSPSADGRIWGLMCEDANFNPLGFVALDVVAHTVLWHANNSVRPDHVSMSPSGRWFEVSGDDARGTVAYGIAADNLGQTVQLHHKSEHSDLGICNGRDFYASVDYQTDHGDIFYTYLDDGVRHVIGYLYGHPNPWFGTNYAVHISAKAFGKCGFLSSNYGVPPANIVWFSLDAPYGPFGVGMNYAVDQNYFDEVQAAISRDGTEFFYNDNFGGPSQSGDVWRGVMPQ